MRFHGSIFLSAFLLFQVQLILGKYLLPWFGGAPAVWTTCILFFQGCLLVGYAYGFFLDQKLSLLGQVRLHACLLVVSIAGLGIAWLNWGSPIFPSGEWKPLSVSMHPIAGVLMILLVSVGLSYTLLAANSPLVQRWYGVTLAGKTPYRLYAVSNVGSLLALLSYPFWIEPNVPLRQQAIIWVVLYGLFGVATFACMLRVLRFKPSQARILESPAGGAGPDIPFLRLFWLILASCPSIMLLAVTNDISQEVAVTPFIWVLPLAIYLLSFIICFDHSRWYSRRYFVLLTYATSIVVLITSLKGFGLGMTTQLVSYNAFLFCFCMVCHGELYRLRPGQSRLTAFYLTIALGGVSGGIIVGIVAPLLFKDYWEFHLTIFTSWVLLAYIFWKDKASFLNTGDRWHFFGLVLLVAYVLSHYTLVFSGGYGTVFISRNREVANLLLALLISMAVFLPVRRYAFIQSPLWPRLLIASLVFIVESFAVYRVRGTGSSSLAAARNFFGVVKVTEESLFKRDPLPVRKLVHGKILHGYQFMRGEMELRPTSYYVSGSGIGHGFRLQKALRKKAPLRIGVTGLGAGAIAAHVRPGDWIRFYEINPIVVEYAWGPSAWFTYLNKSGGTVEVKMGDARLSLEDDLASHGSNQFDLLVLDAFSSDSVPLHLLTYEAFQTYIAHLRDADSILAVNITNRILNLRDPVLSHARKLGYSAVVIRDSGELPIPVGSVWILISRGQILDDPGIKAVAEIDHAFQPLVWTDDFSNLWKVLRQR